MHSVTSNAVAEANSYSTTERFTGKYWKDGKKIYAKTIICPVVSGDREYSHGIQNLDFVTHIEGVSKQTTANGFRTIPFVYYGNIQRACDVYATTSQVGIESGSSFASYHSEAFITIEYTKTTD